MHTTPRARQPHPARTRSRDRSPLFTCPPVSCALRRRNPGMLVETLSGDFGGNMDSVATVAASGAALSPGICVRHCRRREHASRVVRGGLGASPCLHFPARRVATTHAPGLEVFAHNIETVEALQRYGRALQLLCLRQSRGVGAQTRAHPVCELCACTRHPQTPGGCGVAGLCGTLAQTLGNPWTSSSRCGAFRKRFCRRACTLRFFVGSTTLAGRAGVDAGYTGTPAILLCCAVAPTWRTYL